MQNELNKPEWMRPYKRRMVFGILAVLSASVVLTMYFIAHTLRSRLIEDSKNNTWELSEVIGSSLRHLMQNRNTEKIQETLEVIGKSESTIMKAFILDKSGRVVYSSRKEETGLIIDRYRENSCSVCHTSRGAIPLQTTMILKTGEGEILRNVNVIHNEPACHSCHPAGNRINGKLIIDRRIEPTLSLIANIELIIALSGGLCLIILVPLLSRFLSRGVDIYIREVDARSTELGMLYMIVERLSKTIDMEELKRIVIGMITELFDVDEVHILLAKEGAEHGGIFWSKKDGRIDRRPAPGHDPHHSQIGRWLAGGMISVEVSENNTLVSIPIAKGESSLALILLRKESGISDAVGLSLIKAMGSHIAVAFENAALYRIAITDELTGLFTKRYFHQMIEKKFELFEQYGEKLTLLMIDIDNFKMVNDTYGHPAGDHVLKDLAWCILQSTRDQDFAFRYGGEEFSVILPATDVAAGSIVAERIREAVEKNVFSVEENSLQLTVSVGVASCPSNALSIRDLVLEADRTLYEAKRSGKNRVVLSTVPPHQLNS